MGENLCQLYILQGIKSQNKKGAQKTNLLKNQKPLNKWAIELKTQFSKEEVQMAISRKKCSISLAIKEMQIKTPYIERERVTERTKLY
jgi:hypothetical protein